MTFNGVGIKIHFFLMLARQNNIRSRKSWHIVFNSVYLDIIR